MASVLIILPEEEINWFVSLSLSSLLLYQLLCKQRDQESAYLINKMRSIVTLHGRICFLLDGSFLPLKKICPQVAQLDVLLDVICVANNIIIISGSSNASFGIIVPSSSPRPIHIS